MLSDNDTGIYVRAAETQLIQNDVRGGDFGMSVLTGEADTHREHDRSIPAVGIWVGATSSATLSGNTLCGNGVNLSVADGAEPRRVPRFERRICAEDGLAVAAE